MSSAAGEAVAAAHAAGVTTPAAAVTSTTPAVLRVNRHSQQGKTQHQTQNPVPHTSIIAPFARAKGGHFAKSHDYWIPEAGRGKHFPLAVTTNCFAPSGPP